MADGQVRCGSCLNTFSALQHDVSSSLNKVSDSSQTSPLQADNSPLDTLTKDTLTKPAPEPTQADLKPSPDNTIRNKTDLHQSLAFLQHEESLEILHPEQLSAIDEEPLEIIHNGAPRSALMTSFLVLCNLFFLITLASQYTWFNLDSLIKKPHLEPASEFLCTYITCPEQNQFDLNLLYTEDLFIQSHPDYANALQVDFIFSNGADFEQAFPLATLSFSSSRNLLLASRQFTPEEYLPLELRQFSTMPANSSVQVSLEIIDPGQDAVNYAMSFSAP